MNAQQTVELQRVREDLVAKRQPPFMKGVIATAIGPKIVKGKFDGAPSLHFVVDRKVAREDLTLKRIIPPEIDGIPTDVIRQRGELLPEPSFVPADAVAIGYGTAMITNAGEAGTLATVGRRRGELVLITSAHVAPKGIRSTLREPPRTNLGVTDDTRELVTGAEIYGSWAANPNENFFLDVAVIAADENLNPQGGLPGAFPFKVAPNTASLVAGLPTSRVLSYGAGTGGWRQGTVTSIWARPNETTATGLCFVEHDPGLASIPGDSGSLWLVRRGTDFVALGLHWGLIGGLAFVTDLTGSLPLLGIDSLAGDPGPA